MTTTAPETPRRRTTLEDGRVVAIAGPVIDVEFPPHALPEINYAVEFDIELDGDQARVTAEVAQQIGEGRVRCICMQPTDGLRARRRRCATSGRGITVPVGDAVLGHVFNVLGRAARHRRHRQAVDDYWEIHRNAPAFDQLEPRARCSRPASRSSTCSSPTCRAARSASSAVPAWARPSSSRR